MDKTIEEMEKAVLAYCEEVCPKFQDSYEIEGVVTLYREHGGIRVYNFDTNTMIFTSGKSNREGSIRYHYRLLGLDARDAVAEVEAQHAEKVQRLIESMRRQDEVYTTLYYAHLDSKEELDRTQRKYAKADANLQSERSRNTALVAAINQAVFDLTDEDADPEEDAFDFGQRIAEGLELALAVNTEKGGSDEA